MSPPVRRARPTKASVADPAVAIPVASVPAPDAALRQALVALVQAQQRGPSRFDGADHWPRDARPSGTAESRERLAHTGERQIWMAQDAAQDAAQTAFAREVAAYTRALQPGGIGLRQVLAAIAAVVREAAAPSPAAGPLDAIAHDAGRYCVAAWFARTSPGELASPHGA